MSIVKLLIVNADAECRHLTPAEVDQIETFVASGARRVRLVQVLADGRDRIVKQAANQLCQKNPSLVAPGGRGNLMTATCLHDMDHYLRLVSYGVDAGDAAPIEDIR